MRPSIVFVPVLLAAFQVGCEKKLSEDARIAQEVAKTADARVAALEKELQELKAAKPDATADREAADLAKQQQAKAVARQLEDAKRRAEEKKKAAQEEAAKPTPPPEAPKAVLLDIPVGTKLEIRLAKDVTTEKAQPGDPWEGTLAAPVVLNGKSIWVEGTPVKGVVTQSTPAGRLASGKGGLGIKLTQVGPDDVDTGVYLVAGDVRGERNAKYIAGGAALGALIGVLSDKKNKNDHALGGAAIGAAAGTAAAAATAKTVIVIPADKPVTFELARAEKVKIKP